MKKIIPLILMLFIAGCCPPSNVFYSMLQKEFVGIWQAGNDENALLTITFEGDQTYSLKFTNGNVEWEGMGYQYGNKLIAVFRYKGINESGYVTFKLANMNKINYVSMNPDGSVRARQYYIRLNR